MPRTRNPKAYGRISSWLRSHGDRKIPRDYKALSLVSGASVNAIKCYLYRQRRAARERLLTVPDLRSKRLALQAITGEKIVGSQIATYEYHVDRFTLEIGLTAVLKDGQRLVFSIPSLKVFAQRVKEVLK
jgi:hypothetical protein